MAGLGRLGVGLGSVIGEELVAASVDEGDSDEEVEDNNSLTAEDFADITEVRFM